MMLQNWDNLWFVVIIISLFLVVYPAVRRNMQLKKWRNHLQIDRHEKVFNQLYESVNGFELSKKSRQHNDAIAYTYGEIQFQSFIALLSLCQPDEQTIFYDLGSGSGKAVIAAAMVFPLKKSVGIECLSSLHKIAEHTAQTLMKDDAYQAKRETIHFLHEDFFECNWLDANLIFINSTTIIGDFWHQLTAQLEELAKDTLVITTTKSIASDCYEIIYCTDVLMSWGIVTAYIHRKVSRPH